MPENIVPTYETTSFKKNDAGAIVYIALASLGALVILLGALYFMFFNNGEQQVTSSQNTNVINNKTGNSAGNVSPTPTSTAKPTSAPTPTISATATPTLTEEPDSGTFNTQYIYGAFQTSDYKLSDDKTQIIKISDNSVAYTAPNGYTLVSFAIAKPSIFVVLKTPEAYTYEFRKVVYGSNNLGGLFYKYYSAYAMTSFVVDPVNYEKIDTYLIMSSLIKKQFLVLDIKNFKEAGKKVITAPGYAEFKAAYKLANQNAIKIEYTKSDNTTGSVLVSFE